MNALSTEASPTEKDPIHSNHPRVEQPAPAESSLHRRPGWYSLQNSLPNRRTITSLDLDVTEACNLACTYCFKWQKKAVHMDEATAMSAIDWLLGASGDYQGELRVNLIGGEPLLRFDLIQKIVPYGKCRARQKGKSLHFGCTTNCTMLTDEILAFWRKFGMGFHCSIDGVPEVQNANRPTLGGGPSSDAVEKNAKKILAYRPEVMARATITPRSVRLLEKSAKYIASLGFRFLTFKMAVNCDWKAEDYEALKSQYEKMAAFYVERLISGNTIHIDEFVRGLRSLHSDQSSFPIPCGAGTGLAMIDPRGDIWPCHRFGPHICGGQFCLGKIGGVFNNRLRNVFLNYHTIRDGRAGCDDCRAALVCRSWCYGESISCTNTLYDPGVQHCEGMRILYDQVVKTDSYLRAYHPHILSDVLKQNI